MRRIKKITQTIEVEEEEKNAIERLFSSFFFINKKGEQVPTLLLVFLSHPHSFWLQRKSGILTAPRQPAMDQMR
jgi:hypothetical protein